MKISFSIFMMMFFVSAFGLEVSVSGTKNSYFTNKHVYNGFGCTGENSIPEIKWSGVPKETESMGLTIYDPDAPTGSGWWHWLVSDIPTTFLSLRTKNLKKILKKGAVESMTSYGKPGYGGPCPPKGDTPHRYVVTVYALKKKIKIKPETTPAIVGFMLNKNAIATATTTLLFGR